MLGALLSAASAAGAEVTEAMWRELMQANAELRATVATQQAEISELRTRVDQLDQAGTRRESTVADLREQIERSSAPAVSARATTNGKLVLSGEVGAAFFAGEANSHYANDEFRVDEATLRVEAEAARGIYLFGELQLAKRETRDEAFHLGEFYVEFEDIGGDATPGRLFNLRAGRVDVPFGEEYLVRDLLTNPLITHSLSDIWGTDEGVEIYGELGRATYAFAIQNGNAATLRDFTADKSYTARVGFDPLPQLHLSASAMRTGELDATRDFVSEIWIGNVAFRSIGSDQTTRFEGEIAEVDATWSWDGGHLWGALGWARYDDNDPLADNRRNFDYHQLELVQDWSPQLYFATRYSAIAARDGYPIAGIGNFGNYFFGPWTTRLWRFSVGGGYRFNPAVLLKLEYTFEQGRLRNGTRRTDSDQFAAEAVVGF